MLHARVVRPRGQGGVTSQNHYPISVDENSIKHLAGVQVVHVGNFLAVVSAKEYDAIQAAAQLKVVWKSDPKLPGSGNFWTWLRTAGRHEHDHPARLTTNVGQRRLRARVGVEDDLGDLQVRLQRPHVDRPDVRGSQTSRPTHDDLLQLAAGRRPSPRR